MGKTFIGIRDVDEETFRKFRTIAVARQKKIGDLLTKLLIKYIQEEKYKEENKPNPKNLIKITGIIKTKEKVKWSEEIDDILYE